MQRNLRNNQYRISGLQYFTARVAKQCICISAYRPLSAFKPRETTDILKHDVIFCVFPVAKGVLLVQKVVFMINVMVRVMFTPPDQTRQNCRITVNRVGRPSGKV